MTSIVRVKHLYEMFHHVTILSVTGLCDSLAFKVTINKFDVTDGTAAASRTGTPTVFLTHQLFLFV